MVWNVVFMSFTSFACTMPCCTMTHAVYVRTLQNGMSQLLLGMFRFFWLQWVVNNNRPPGKFYLVQYASFFYSCSVQGLTQDWPIRNDFPLWCACCRPRMWPMPSVSRHSFARSTGQQFTSSVTRIRRLTTFTTQCAPRSRMPWTPGDRGSTIITSCQQIYPEAILWHRRCSPRRRRVGVWKNIFLSSTKSNVLFTCLLECSTEHRRNETYWFYFQLFACWLTWTWCDRLW